MRHIEIQLDGPVNPSLGESLEAAFSGCGLRITLRGTTASLPGSTHWHLKRGNLAGTLEATLWPKQNRFWLTVQDGRRAPWIDESLPEIVAALERVCNPNE